MSRGLSPSHVRVGHVPPQAVGFAGGSQPRRTLGARRRGGRGRSGHVPGTVPTTCSVWTCTPRGCYVRSRVAARPGHVEGRSTGAGFGSVRQGVGADRRERRGRTGRDGIRVHRGTDLDGRRVAALQRHAGRQAAAVASGRRRRGAARPEQQVQRDDTRQRRQPARLRARHELTGARVARRDARDDRLALGRTRVEQPERRDRRLRRRNPLHRPDLRPDAWVRPRA